MKCIITSFKKRVNSPITRVSLGLVQLFGQPMVEGKDGFKKSVTSLGGVSEGPIAHFNRVMLYSNSGWC